MLCGLCRLRSSQLSTFTRPCGWQYTSGDLLCAFVFLPDSPLPKESILFFVVSRLRATLKTAISETLGGEAL